MHVHFVSYLKKGLNLLPALGPFYQLVIYCSGSPLYLLWVSVPAAGTNGAYKHLQLHLRRVKKHTWPNHVPVLVKQSLPAHKGETVCVLVKQSLHAHKGETVCVLVKQSLPAHKGKQFVY